MPPIVVFTFIWFVMSAPCWCIELLEQLLTPDATATILKMKAPQIVLELFTAEGLSLINS
jgi:hypothetical protein